METGKDFLINMPNINNNHLLCFHISNQNKNRIKFTKLGLSNYNKKRFKWSYILHVTKTAGPSKEYYILTAFIVDSYTKGYGESISIYIRFGQYTLKTRPHNNSLT